MCDRYVQWLHCLFRVGVAALWTDTVEILMKGSPLDVRVNQVVTKVGLRASQAQWQWPLWELLAFCAGLTIIERIPLTVMLIVSCYRKSSILWGTSLPRSFQGWDEQMLKVLNTELHHTDVVSLLCECPAWPRLFSLENVISEDNAHTCMLSAVLINKLPQITPEPINIYVQVCVQLHISLIRGLLCHGMYLKHWTTPNQVNGVFWLMLTAP